jgi:hypothetical protein
MRAPTRNKPSTPRPGNNFLQRQLGSLERVRKRLLGGADAGEASKAFGKLVTANCDPEILLILLANVTEDLDTWEARLGFRPRELKGVIRRMQECAEGFERLDRNGFLRLAAWPRFKDKFTPPEFSERFAGMPALLRGCADALKTAASSPRFKPRAHAFTNTALAQLVGYIQHCTGAPHDNEASALLNALGKTGRDDGPYTADALKTWRDEHAEYIHHAAQMLPSLFGR